MADLSHIQTMNSGMRPYRDVFDDVYKATVAEIEVCMEPNDLTRSTVRPFHVRSCLRIMDQHVQERGTRTTMI